MEIKKFKLNSDDIDIVADLILSAYSEGGQNISYDNNSKQIVKDLVEIGNNFIGHENIYLCLVNNDTAGLIIGYTGKSYSRLNTLIGLLIRLKLTQILNYLIISSQLFDSTYTPYLKENDFYISVIVVDEKYRQRGIGTYLLEQTILLAKEKRCKKIILDVDRDNMAAQSLYHKFGFILQNSDHQKQITKLNDNNFTMVYSLS